ncbi:unnamed protein product [Amoebophrya sp. A120]|nr:unnamed protein product [Amoebophrya sp. A120]|eukprot:GSA120T00014434001.1
MIMTTTSSSQPLAARAISNWKCSSRARDRRSSTRLGRTKLLTWGAACSGLMFGASTEAAAAAAGSFFFPGISCVKTYQRGGRGGFLHQSAAGVKMALLTTKAALLASVTTTVFNTAPVAAQLDASWTSYSEQADMPQSEQWRSNMREKLKSVDYESLSDEQKQRYKEMMFQLNGGKSGKKRHGSSWEEPEDDDADGSYPLQRFGLILLVVAFLGYQHFYANRNMNGGAGLGQGAPAGANNQYLQQQGTGAGSSWMASAGSSSSAGGQTAEQREAMRQARLRQFENKPTSEPMPNPWKQD